MTLPGIFNNCCPHNTTSCPNKQEGQGDTRYSIWRCNPSGFSSCLWGFCKLGVKWHHPSKPVLWSFKRGPVLLQERGLHEEVKLNAQCQKFKCRTGNKNCCQRRVLYHQPDFVQAKSLLKELCEARGYTVLFLPKFHCGLNFIEQCWGFAKRVYRKFPASSKEADLENNVLSALESVPLESMRKSVKLFYIFCFQLNMVQVCNSLFKIHGCIWERSFRKTGCLGIKEI